MSRIADYLSRSSKLQGLSGWWGSGFSGFCQQHTVLGITLHNRNKSKFTIWSQISSLNTYLSQQTCDSANHPFFFFSVLLPRLCPLSCPSLFVKIINAFKSLVKCHLSLCRLSGLLHKELDTIFWCHLVLLQICLLGDCAHTLTMGPNSYSLIS